MSEENELWADAVRRGDVDFVRRRLGRLWRAVAARHDVDPDDGEQEALIACFRAIVSGRVDPGRAGSIRSYLRQAGVWAAMNAGRTARRPEGEGDDMVDLPAPPAVDTAALREEVEALGEPVLLHYVEALGRLGSFTGAHAEVARRLGVTRATMLARWYRATNRVRSRCAG